MDSSSFGPGSKGGGEGGGGRLTLSVWPVNCCTRVKKSLADFRASAAQARNASAAKRVCSQTPSVSGPAKPPSTKKTPSRVNFTGCSESLTDPPLMLKNPPCQSSSSSGARTSVLSPYQWPPEVINRFEFGKTMFQRFLASGD